jgi:hypothetical protein
MLKTAVDEFRTQRSHDSEKSEHVSTSDLRELFLVKMIVRISAARRSPIGISAESVAFAWKRPLA